MFTIQTKQTWMKIFTVALLAISIPAFAQAQGQSGQGAADKPGSANPQAAAFGPGGPGGPGGFFGAGPGRGFGRFGRFGGPEAGRPFMMAHRGGEGWGREEHKGWKHLSPKMLLNPQVRQKLGLTDDQVKKIQDLTYNNEKQVIELETKLKLAELDMRRLMQEKRPDRGKVLSQVDAIAQAKTAVAKQKVTGMLDVRDILTDQQVDQIHKFIQERATEWKGERMRERFHERGGFGGPGFGGMHGRWGGGQEGRGGQGAPTPPQK
jgi:Spy/CpxP family protein refolding chaperone